MASSFLLASVALAFLPLSIQSIIYDRLGGIRYVLIFPVIGALLTAWAAIASVRQWRRGASPGLARIRFTAVVLVAIAFVWSLHTWNLLGWKL